MSYFTKRFSYTFTAISVFTILITSIMDLNSTHMTNPLWTPHARFHWACLYFATIAMSLIALYCIYGTYKDKGTRLSKLCIGLSPIFFWGMFIPAALMPGASTAPDGISIPSNFPELFTIVHPNFIIGCLISVISVFVMLKELKIKFNADIQLS